MNIKRIPTIVSFKQLQEDGKLEEPSSGPTAPVSHCAGSKLPIYIYCDQAPSKPSFKRSASQDSSGLVPDVDNLSERNDSSLGWSRSAEDNVVPVPSMPLNETEGDSNQIAPVTGRSVLDMALLALWEDCAEKGLFRYDVTACSTKLVPGEFGFIAQLNEGRASNKRPTELVLDKVCQPFNDAKFNFKKAFVREILLQFESRSSRQESLERHGIIEKNADPSGPLLLDAVPASSSPTLVIINVSPIEYGHVLLVPRVLDSLPQAMDVNTFMQALHFTREADNPYFRVGYNSLGAYATINHLHFQGYYLAAPFPCERAPCALLSNCQPLRTKHQIAVLQLAQYPVRGFVVEVGSLEAEALAETAQLVAHIVGVMQRIDMPHNVLICDGGMRIFIWPQCFAEAQTAARVPAKWLETQVNPAVFEIAGHMVLKRAKDYEEIDQAWAWRLLEQASLSEESFQKLATMCFGKA